MTPETTTRARRRVLYHAGQAAIVTFECYVLAELVFYVVNNGERRLYEAAAEKLVELRVRLTYRAQVLDTLRMIRRLPEE